MQHEFDNLLLQLQQVSDGIRELGDGIRQVAAIAADDPEMALIRTRKVLEYVVRDVYVRREGKPPGTQPLENLITQLAKDGYFPLRLKAYATVVKDLGNVGAHSFGEGCTHDDVHRSLTQLLPILEWFFEHERPDDVAPPQPAGRPAPQSGAGAARASARPSSSAGQSNSSTTARPASKKTAEPPSASKKTEPPPIPPAFSANAGRAAPQQAARQPAPQQPVRQPATQEAARQPPPQESPSRFAPWRFLRRVLRIVMLYFGVICCVASIAGFIRGDPATASGVLCIGVGLVSLFFVFKPKRPA